MKVICWAEGAFCLQCRSGHLYPPSGQPWNKEHPLEESYGGGNFVPSFAQSLAGRAVLSRGDLGYHGFTQLMALKAEVDHDGAKSWRMSTNDPVSESFLEEGSEWHSSKSNTFFRFSDSSFQVSKALSFVLRFPRNLCLVLFPIL